MPKGREPIKLPALFLLPASSDADRRGGVSSAHSIIPDCLKGTSKSKKYDADVYFISVVYLFVSLRKNTLLCIQIALFSGVDAFNLGLKGEPVQHIGQHIGAHHIVDVCIHCIRCFMLPQVVRGCPQILTVEAEKAQFYFAGLTL